MNCTDTFAEHGYIIFKDLLPQEHILALSEEVDRIHRQWLECNRTEYMERLLVNMHSLTDTRYFDGCDGSAARVRFFSLLLPQALTSAVERVAGDGVHFHNTQLFFNPFENRRLPYWHRDLQYSPIPDAEQAREQHRIRALHVRIPLLPEQGVELIPGTHRRWDTGLERLVRFEKDGHSNSEDLPGATLITLAPGDVLMFDAQMVHRGNYARNRERKALDLCAGNVHPMTVRYLDAKILPHDDELERIANNKWYARARQVVAHTR